MARAPVLIGTAGWTIPGAVAAAFPGAGTSLERYGARFACAEINSSFHRSHRAATWARWAASVPATFRFAAKLPKAITHQAKLAGADPLLAAALDEMRPLGDRLALLLVQLPPSLAFEAVRAGAFFDALRGRWTRGIACEPRHPSWLEAEADRLLDEHEVARVAADPARAEGFDRPGGWAGLAYYRLHGSPVMYRSAYGEERLAAYAEALRRHAEAGRESWCIFDNTASGAASADALALQRLVDDG
ncbi:MAG: DUF72 domain-containing protein [Alphaproteobacteria bacterium]|nr:DUF72 domain-containing protein [Alphaproteobacteria bacterium]